MSRIHKQYVIMPSVAVYSCLNPQLLSGEEQILAFACHAFLSRAIFHGVVLHVPMVFYSDVVEAAFSAYQDGFVEFDECQALARTMLETNWDYRIPNSDDMLEMERQISNAKFGHGEYLAVAAQLGCPIITTQMQPIVTTAQLKIMQLENHPWASTGALDLHPPNE